MESTFLGLGGREVTAKAVHRDIILERAIAFTLVALSKDRSVEERREASHEALMLIEVLARD